MNVGIIGTGGIARIAIEKIKKIENAEVTAIWCHTLEHGVAIAKEYEIDNLFTDINEFLADNSYSIVYVAVPNQVHYYYMKKALLSGKNVICEKPFTATAKEAKELIDLAIKKKLFLFDGTANRYYENYYEIKRRLPEIGRVKMMHLNMSQYSSKYDSYCKEIVFPVFSKAGCGGALYDLNSINVLFVVGLFGEPVSQEYFPNKGFNGIDTSGILILNYGEFQVDCIAAKDSNCPGYMMIQGEKGYISMLMNPGLVENIDLVKNDEQPECIDIEKVTDQRENLFRKIFEIVQKKDYSRCYRELKDTEITMNILENIRKRESIFFLEEEEREMKNEDK